MWFELKRLDSYWPPLCRNIQAEKEMCIVKEFAARYPARGNRFPPEEPCIGL